MKSKISIEEANEWHFRNFNRPPTNITIEAVKKIKKNWFHKNDIENILELGCSDGRNAPLILKHVSKYTGIDPSPKAVAEGINNGLNLKTGWAHSFKLNQQFDIIILGFFMYLTSPEHWFNIAQNVYSHLKTDSFIVITDFYADEIEKKIYDHDPAMNIHKFNFNRMFNWHPTIKTISDDVLTENITQHNNTELWYRTSIMKVSK